jgi:hypothetical protein
MVKARGKQEREMERKWVRINQEYAEINKQTVKPL